MTDGQPGEIKRSYVRFTAGGPDDPKHAMGRCLTCRTKIVNYQEATGVWIDVEGHSHTGHEIEVSQETASPANLELQNSSEPETKIPRVTQRITDVGYYYRVGDKELGPYTVEDEQDPRFDDQLATKLGVEPKEILLARQKDAVRPTTFDEIGEVLRSTIRHDLATKLILFCAMILTFTDEDQINILMSGESAGGKSYNALEVAAYFPQETVITIATASPTAFFHDVGKWDEEARVLRVNLRRKILIFLDQPHFTLMERLRPLLSHDRRELLYKITDKSKGGPMRTKNVVLEGFPTVVFCAAKLSLDEQERTRVFILSPETSPEKLEESLRLAIARVGDREEFKRRVESHPRRRWLKARIAAIRDAQIIQVVIEDQEGIYGRFLSQRQRLAPRHQRDLPRILALIKTHALLNFRYRESPREGTIVASQDDVEAGFWLYSLIARSNELGLSPQVYEIHETVIKPRLVTGSLVRKDEISRLYVEKYGRPLAWQRLDREILPALEASGLISLQPDPDDRRRIVVVSPITYNISPEEPRPNNIVSDRGSPLFERIQTGLAWLSRAENHDADGWASLDKFRDVVGGPDVVQLMLRDGLVMLHPTDPNKVRLVRR